MHVICMVVYMGCDVAAVRDLISLEPHMMWQHRSCCSLYNLYGHLHLAPMPFSGPVDRTNTNDPWDLYVPIWAPLMYTRSSGDYHWLLQSCVLAQQRFEGRQGAVWPWRIQLFLPSLATSSNITEVWAPGSPVGSGLTVINPEKLHRGAHYQYPEQSNEER